MAGMSEAEESMTDMEITPAAGQPKPLEIVFAGQGGQGLRLVSLLLGQACASKGLQVACSASYGPEVRGTFTRSEVLIAEGLIIYPRVLAPDLAAILSQEAYDRLLPEMPAGGWLLYDEDAIRPTDTALPTLIPLPASRAAAGAGSRSSANMFMLGAITALIPYIEPGDLTKLLTENRKEANCAALEAGYQAGLALRERLPSFPLPEGR